MKSYSALSVLFVLTIISCLFYAYFTPQTIRAQKTACPSPQVLEVDFRRRLADKIDNVQMDIARLAGTGNVDAKWALQLSEVVAELDPRRRSSLGAKDDWDFSARKPEMGPAPRNKLDGQLRSVCPEVYKFKNDDSRLFLEGTYQENCNYVPKFYEILTVLLPDQFSRTEDLISVTNRITKYYNVRLLGFVKNASAFRNPIPKHLGYLEVRDTESDSDILARALKSITTPFVLIAHSLSQFNDQSSLERLVRVLDELPSVMIAGGAARDSQGRWIHGCLQQKMENYQASYDQGYYSSKYECMYCDDLLTPFVTFTKLFEQIPLEKSLNGPVVFHDWFVRVRQAGHLAVTCPDVMFYVNNHPRMTTSDWRSFGKKWSLSRIKSYNDTVLDFPCSEVNISCKDMRSVVKSYLIPPCCLEKISKEIGFILDFADKHNLHYEMNGGTALGAVKMGAHLPWDLDMDFVFVCDDNDKWMKIKDSHLKNRKCKLTEKKKGIYFVIFCPTLFYEFHCAKKINSTLSRHIMPQEFIDTPTKISFNGRWTSAPSNPGLSSRNNYGLEDLRHAPHWRFLKKESKWGQYDNPGAWNKCLNPHHHACLDHFPADGSLPFVKR